MKRLLILICMLAALNTHAFALEVPSETTVQNLNGSQQLIKTYTVSPEVNPQDLVEEPFSLEGYQYSFADITKEENRRTDSVYHTETVTLETSTDNLSEILGQLAPTIEYDDGTYSGTLTLDHTSLQTVAAGYTTKSYTVSDTKTIGQLDRNDMSYIPATTIKDGKTLNLADVSWQVTGTELVGEALVPSSYQAVATYTGRAYYSAATGYVTTVQYVGDVVRDDVDSITYQVLYLGEKEDGILPTVSAFFDGTWPFLLGGGALAAITVLSVLLMKSRREAARFRREQEEGLPPDSYEEEEKGE